MSKPRTVSDPLVEEELVRALALVEWFGDGQRECCKWCEQCSWEGHALDCSSPVVAAFTKAGVTPEDREAIRKAVGR